MAALTRLEIVSEICDVVGKSTSATSTSNVLLSTRVVRWLNLAQQRICRMYSFDELKAISTTAATVDTVKRYPLETGTNNLGLTGIFDIESIRLIDGENSRKLKRLRYQVMDRQFPRPENFTTDRPSFYARYGDFIEMFKIPNDAYTLWIRYSKWATELTTDSQTPDFLEKDQLLIAAGVLEAYLGLEEYADAKLWFERLSGLMLDATRGDTDTDWSPTPDAMTSMGTVSGTPWLDPYGESGDPLAGYP